MKKTIKIDENIKLNQKVYNFLFIYNVYCKLNF